MNGKYDSTSKDLFEINPVDWLAFFGQPRPPERVRSIDADLSTIAPAADKVIFVDDLRPWILHIEFQTTRDDELPDRMFMYNALLRRRHGVQVVSVVILLRPSADSPSMTGIVRTEAPMGDPWEFRYEVIRLWTLPVARLLSGP